MNGQSLRVWLVDDDASMRNALAGLFEAEGAAPA